MLKLVTKIFVLTFFLTLANLNAQDARITGNFQFESQYYQKDSIISAPEVAEKNLNQGFLNLIYNQDAFEVGMRYEMYKNPLLGIDQQYAGSGIAYRYVTYKSDFIDVTAGDFYEQFGSGMIFRSYEERALGIDNAMDGIRFKVRPMAGITFTGIYGNQRSFWGKGEGIVRGGDLSINANDLLGMESEYSINIGGSMVSKFEADKESQYNLPLNVMAYATRVGLITGSLSFDAEYAYKYNDPSAANNFNFAEGKGIIISAAYFGDGISFSVNAHSIDNMDFRSDRDALGNNLLLSFVPPLTKQHTYRLATVYPFGTQLMGEAGYQAEFTYKIPRGSDLGGEYGTDLNINFSRVTSVKQALLNDNVTRTSSLFEFDDRVYFQDLNLDISRKISKEFKAALSFVSMIYDKDKLENGGAAKYGKVTSNAIILDLTYKIDETNAIRTELQHLWSKNDSTSKEADNINGNWLYLMAEYTIAPEWYFTVYDEFNYGNEFEDRQLHYLNASVAYILGTSRVSLAYGRQRGGIICVGGVCRPVPASNGFYLSVSSSF